MARQQLTSLNNNSVIIYIDYDDTSKEITGFYCDNQSSKEKLRVIIKNNIGTVIENFLFLSNIQTTKPVITTQLAMVENGTELETNFFLNIGLE